MLFFVGYQLCRDDRFTDTVLLFKEHIGEVYFAYGDFKNGRNISVQSDIFSPEDAVQKQERDLYILKEAGLRLNLLLNGNCYGDEALSREFFLRLGDTAEQLKEEFGLAAVTTTSPVIAKFIKNNFTDTEVRASVNMEIGTPLAADYISEHFDSFYMKREFNRDRGRLEAMREWCDKKGKKLFGLANSGCLNFCSARTFHDNLVSHEREISLRDNAYDFSGQCYTWLEGGDNKSLWLQVTNFIRPEEVSVYEKYFDGLKLATRVSRSFSSIIRAYASGSYSGNLPDLLEPSHAGSFYPAVIENKKIPVGFAEKVLGCDKNCRVCGYCKNAQSSATVILDQEVLYAFK